MRIPSEHEYPGNRMVKLMASFITFTKQLKTAAQFATQYPAFFNGSETVLNIASTSVNSSTVVVFDLFTRQILFICQGLDNFDLARGCLTGWIASAAQSDGTNSPYSVAASLIWGQVPNNSSKWAKIIVTGHSYGGATGMNLVASPKDRDTVCPLYCYTFGSPKPCLRAGVTRFATINVRRFFLPFDPVCSLPPTTHEMTGLWALQSVSDINAWAQWQQPTLGNELEDNGLVTPSANPTYINPGGYLSSLFSWVTGTSAFGSANHAWSAYDARVSSLLDDQGQGGGDIPEQALRPIVTRVTVAEVRANGSNDVAVQNAIVAVDPGSVAREVLQGTPVIHGVRFKGTRRNGHNVVTYAGNIVLFVKKRRALRAMVKYLNKSLIGP